MKFTISLLLLLNAVVSTEGAACAAGKVSRTCQCGPRKTTCQANRYCTVASSKCSAFPPCPTGSAATVKCECGAKSQCLAKQVCDKTADKCTAPPTVKACADGKVTGSACECGTTKNCATGRVMKYVD
ncbi:hypothetical protein AAVH_27273 [Aphelenchoides avenae]|nr:hypothetical protein AAVH_27273 [Aphelenchus avenae]